MSNRIALRSFNPSTRLAGHGLRAEGKPCQPDGDGGYILDYQHGRRTGRGLCSCGARSAVLESDNARRSWHKKHKEQVREEAAK